jgi:hypothetical protein
MARGLFLASAFVFVFALAGCDQVMDAINDGNQNNEEEEEEPAFVAVTGITLLEDSRVAGTEIDLNALADVTPENATVKTPIKWFVVDPGTTGVAQGSVADDGTITPSVAGTLTLSATIENAIAEGTDDYVKEDIVITVTEAFIPVTGITWTLPTGKKAGEAFEIENATVQPETATHKIIRWSVAADSAVDATLSGTPVTTVTPAAGGTLKLSATIENGTAEGTNWTVAEPFAVTITETYPIMVTPSANGTVSANATREAEGETVTLTATPADNTYRLQAGSLKVNNGDVTVTGSANPYSFTMPANSVTVTAVFELVPPDTFTIEIPSFEHGEVSASADNAPAETVITLTVKPAASYKLKEGTLKVNNGDVVSGSGNTWTFTMPASDVTVAAEFESAVPPGYIPIAIAEDLAKIGVDAAYPLSGNYYQIADITIENDAWVPIGTSANFFTGHFVGSDYIDDNNEKQNYKIFPTIASSSDVSIFGYASGATFENIHIGTGSISTTGSSKEAGGIALTIMDNTVVTNCSNAAAITGVSGAGGICTLNANGSVIKNCSNSGNITVTGKTAVYAGGICGSASTEIQVIACYNEGKVTVAGDPTQPTLGGIVGQMNDSGKIIACYNTGLVSSNGKQAAKAKIYHGGVLGQGIAPDIAVVACYNTGIVEYVENKDNKSAGNVNIGGIIGFSYDSADTSHEIIGNYWYAEDNSSEDKITAKNGIGAKQTASTTAKEPDITSETCNQGMAKFSGEQGGWPSAIASAEWGTGNGQYWKSLGGWNNGSPVYPRLWFEN